MLPGRHALGKPVVCALCERVQPSTKVCGSTAGSLNHLQGKSKRRFPSLQEVPAPSPLGALHSQGLACTSPLQTLPRPAATTAASHLSARVQPFPCALVALNNLYRTRKVACLAPGVPRGSPPDHHSPHPAPSTTAPGARDLQKPLTRRLMLMNTRAPSLDYHPMPSS